MWQKFTEQLPAVLLTALLVIGGAFWLHQQTVTQMAARQQTAQRQTQLCRFAQDDLCCPLQGLLQLLLQGMKRRLRVGGVHVGLFTFEWVWRIEQLSCLACQESSRTTKQGTTMSIVLISHADCLKHQMGEHHPECPERLSAIDDQLIASGIAPLIQRLDAPRASIEQQCWSTGNHYSF